MQDESGLTPRDKARILAAKLTKQLAENVIQPPKQPLVEHMLVIVTCWKSHDESVVMDAIKRGRKRAEEGSSGVMGKLFFGLLRFLGFGYIESTGEGDVTVTHDESCDDVYVITTTIGVRVESTESLAMTIAALADKAKSLPNGVLCALTGIKPGEAVLVDLKVDMA